jgi:N-acetylmuramoyl-L-alanine amidase
VLDPGHGGSDPGAVRGNIYELHINLAISLLVGFLRVNDEVVYVTRME